MEKVQDEAHRIISEKKPPIRERLEDAKREFRERNISGNPPRRRSLRSWAIYETEQEMAPGIDVLLR